SEAQLLEPEVLAGEVELVLESNPVGAVALHAKRIAQDGSETLQSCGRGTRVALGEPDQGVEHVQDEVRVELRPEDREPRLRPEGFGAERPGRRFARPLRMESRATDPDEDAEREKGLEHFPGRAPCFESELPLSDIERVQRGEEQRGAEQARGREE